MAKLVLILDAGHGLHTAGKRTPDGTLREFHFNAPTAKYVGEGITEAYEGVEVHYVHDLDGSHDVPLKERTDKANAIYEKHKGKKDVTVVYVSIHANAFGSGGFNGANGIETYVHSSNPTGSTRLAKAVQTELITDTGLANRGVKTANFHVLRETDMTAILVECGFMTNKAEAQLLKSDAYRRKCAKAIIKGIAKQYGLKAKPAPKQSDLNDGVFYRVVTGSFDSKDNAIERAEALKGAGFDSFLMAYHKE